MLLGVAALLLSFASRGWPVFTEESLTARAAFLVDVTTGKILYQRDADLPLPQASTTKVMTAIVVLESGKKGTDLLRVSKAATRVPSSKLNLRAGQTMTVKDLLYGLLLSSANDAAVVLAEGIGGSVAHFAEMMNLKARQIGATHTHFVNPHGLTAPDHYTTARDLALIFNYAMKNPRFREILQTKTSHVRTIFTGKRKRPRAREIAVKNHNRLLWNFAGAIGGKTGYTYAAQKCFVGGVSRDGNTLIVAILGSRDLWGDTRRLLQYGLENYETLTLASTGIAASAWGAEVGKPQEAPSSPLFSSEEGGSIASRGGYLVQIGSFREQERAQMLQKQISESGYRAYLERTPLNNGEVTYRVRVGPYAELSQAQEAAREIENKSGFRAIIVPSKAQSPEKSS